MNRRSLALTVLSGLLLTVSFPGPGYSFLAWLALVPFLFALRGNTVREGLMLGFVLGLVFFCGTVSWIADAIHVHGHLPLLTASLLTLLSSALLAFFFALFGAVVVHIRATRPAITFLAAPAVWVALEFARTHLFSGFPWLLAGYSQYRFLPAIQVADITGVYGVSFAIVLVNAAVEESISGRKRLAPLLTASAVLVAVLVYGHYRLNAEAGKGGITVAVMQGNIAQDKKWDPAYQHSVIATYKRLTLEAITRNPDLVVWPETATPFYFEGPHQPLTDDLRSFVRSIRTPLLFGSPAYENSERRLLRNSAFLLDRDGMTKTVYNKIHLVPFGEYVPLKSSLLFFAEKLVQAGDDFQAGVEHTVMPIGLPSGNIVTIGTVICYEIIFPDLVREFVDQGATVMTTITNDAWFGRTDAPYQHFSMAVLRAVENRVPVARAANTGISGFIDAKGSILDASGIFTETYLTRTLVPGNTKTFYTRHGDIFSWLCVLGTILAVMPLPSFK